jgi:hypothetical protein
LATSLPMVPFPPIIVCKIICIYLCVLYKTYIQV